MFINQLTSSIREALTPLSIIYEEDIVDDIATGRRAIRDGDVVA